MKDNEPNRFSFQIIAKALKTVKNETLHQAGKVARKHPVWRIPLLCVLFVFLFVYNVFLHILISFNVRKKLAMVLSVVLTVTLILAQEGVAVSVFAFDDDGAIAIGEAVEAILDNVGDAESLPDVGNSGDGIPSEDGTTSEDGGNTNTLVNPEGLTEGDNSNIPGDDASAEGSDAQTDNPLADTGDNTGNTGGADDTGNAGNTENTENTENTGDLDNPADNGENENSENTDNAENTDNTDVNDSDEELSEEISEEPEEELIDEYPVFNQTQIIDGVRINVYAPEGVLPLESRIYARKVSSDELSRINEALEEVHEDGKNVAATYNFDISILDKKGEEIQPQKDAGAVKVTFSLEEVSNSNLEPEVYHMKETGNELVAEELSGEVNEQSGEIVAITDGFSLYTVEFTYNELTYVMEGDSTINLSEILASVGIEINGEIGNVVFSNSELLRADFAADVWTVTAFKPFDTTEWMKLTIGDIEYEIVVTDSQSAAGDQFVLGKFDDTTGTFKDAYGSGSTIYKTVLIMFTDTLVNNESVTLPNNSEYSLNTACSTAYTKILTVNSGKTAGEIASYIRTVKFNNCNKNGQNIKVTLSQNAINYQTVYYEGTGHYYQFIKVNSAVAWTTAYNNAKNMTFLGEPGYLATVTSVNEDIFLNTSVSNATGWLGGTTLKYTSEGDKYYYGGFDTSKEQGCWYWACGPEKGQRILDDVCVVDGTNRTGLSVDQYYKKQAEKYYFNWNSNEPNHDSPGCNCLTILKLSGGSGYNTKGENCWNDVVFDRKYSATDNYSPKGYFVEYGGFSDAGGSQGSNLDMDENGDIQADLPAYLLSAGLTKNDISYNPRFTPNVITLKKDTTLTQSIVLPNNSNVEINLSGHTLTGAVGLPVIKTVDNAKVNIEIISGTVKSVTSSENGADGVTVIDLSKASSGTQITIGEDSKIARVIASNGNNNDIPGEAGGEGGIGIKTNENVNVNISDTSSVLGGDGGNGTSAGKGGDAVGDGTNKTPEGGGGQGGTGGTDPTPGNGGTNGNSGKEHSHSLQFINVPGNEDVIAVYCSSDEYKCIHYAANDDEALLNDKYLTLTVTAQDSVYNGSFYSDADLSGLEAYNNLTGESISTNDIEYYTDENLLNKTTAGNSGAYTDGDEPVWVGDYYAAITLHGVTAKCRFAITKADPVYDEPTDAGKVENGNAQTLLDVTQPKGTFYYRLGEDGEWSTSIPSVSNSGSYVIYYYVKGDNNHKDAGTPDNPRGSITANLFVGVVFDANIEDTNGIVMPDMQKINCGEAPETPSNPDIADDASVMVSGFIGWFSDVECINEYDFEETLEKSVVVYASWKYKPYKVGDKYYDKLQDAVAEGRASDKIVELLSDVEIDEDIVIDEPGLNLNNHTISVAQDKSVSVSGNIVGPGTVKGPGDLVLKDAAVSGTVTNEGNLIIDGNVTVKGSEGNPGPAGNIDNKQSIVINGNGRLTVEPGGGVEIEKKAKIVNDGEIQNDGKIDNKGKISGNKPSGTGKVITPPKPSSPSNPQNIEVPEEVPVPDNNGNSGLPQGKTNQNDDSSADETSNEETSKTEETPSQSDKETGDNTNKTTESEETKPVANNINAVVIPDEATHGVIDDSSVQSVLENILTEEERNSNKDGAIIKIRTEFNRNFETKKEEKKVAKSVKDNMPKGMQALAVYDFNLYKQVGDSDEEKVSTGNVRVSFDIPENILAESSDAVFSVMRVYKDSKGKYVTEIIEVERDGGSLKFDADTESDYVIITDSQTALSANINNADGENGIIGMINGDAGSNDTGCKAHWFVPAISLVYLALLFLIRNKDKKLKLTLFGLGTLAAILTVILGHCKWDVFFACGSVILSLGALNVIKSSEGRVVFEIKNEKGKKAAYIVAGVGLAILVVSAAVCIAMML